MKAATRGLAETSPAGRLPPRRDLALTVATVALDLTLWSDVFRSPANGAPHSGDAVVLAFAALGFLVLLWRRRAPLVAFALLCVHSAAGSLLLTYRPVFPVCVALATVTARRNRPTALLAFTIAVGTSVAWVANEVRTSPQARSATTDVLVGGAYVLVLLVAAGIGRWQHASREHIRVLEQLREEEARLAVAAERLRVARELHDIVAHTVTVMVLQAAGARRVMPVDPGRADAALASVEEAGTLAMGELRRLLGVLRAGDASPGYGDPALRRGIGDLDGLAETVRAAGLHVDLTVSGRPGRLDPSVDLAAYRVVQEALTNTTKHVGPGAHVAVGLEWGGKTMVVTVRDDGKGIQVSDARLSTGHGLLGLAERVSMVGGTLSAAAAPEGGFRVTATLPVVQAVPPVAERPAEAGAGVSLAQRDRPGQALAGQP